jgi:Tol biopolymer transport system component
VSAGPQYDVSVDGRFLINTVGNTALENVSPDGTRLVFTETSPTTAEDVMQVQLEGARRVTPLVRTPFAERNGEVSPDGRWLAYEADDSGQFEIHVRPFPEAASGHWQVSTGGGTRPLWARDSRELFYLSPAGALMRVGVEQGHTWAASPPTKLLEGRLLMIKPDGGSDETPGPPGLIVVQHWVEELKRLVPAE